MNINKRRLHKGNPIARQASQILHNSKRFLLLAEQPGADGQGSELKLFAYGYAAEALIAKELMTVAVNMMKRHKDAVDAAMAEAQQSAPPLSVVGEPEGPPPATEIPPYRGVILPPSEAAPPAFGDGNAD